MTALPTDPTHPEPIDPGPHRPVRRGGPGRAAEPGWPEPGWPEQGWPEQGWPEPGRPGPIGRRGGAVHAAEPPRAAGRPPPDMAGVLDDDVFRSVFRRHAAGVAVVTARGQRPVGFAATSVTSVSLRPRLVSYTISLTSSCWPTMSGAGYFGVHVLGRHQEALAVRFSKSGADRFAEPTRWRLGAYAVPILDDVLAWMVCRVTDRVPAGDHVIMLGEVVAAEHVHNGRPLLYHDGRYAALDG